MTTQLFTETLVLEHCYKCGVAFGMECEYQRIRAERGGDFFCPNGHIQHYIETKVTKLARQLANTESRLSREQGHRREAQRSLVATKGHVTRLRRKVAAGKCPCCKREFPDLAEHMRWKHPGFAGQEA